MKYNYIAIDCSNIIYSGAFMLKGLATEEQETGAIYSFFRSLLYIAEKFHCNRFLFCWDSKESDRLDLFPGYKSTRKKKRDDDPELNEIFQSVFVQINQLQKEILPKIGFRNQFFQRGKEADDLLADLVLNYEGILLVSGDEDMLQLLDVCDVYMPKSEVVWNERKFRAKFNLDPIQWGDVKAIGGCKTDDVPGVVGVGETTAVNYLNGTLSKFTAGGKVRKAYQSIMDGGDIIKRNEPLVKLPMDGTIECYIENDKLVYSEFTTMCQKFLFHTFLDNYSSRWANFFRGRV